MANLTLVIDDHVLRQARIRALERGTSVNAVVRDYLKGYAAGSGQRSARTHLLELSEHLDTGSGSHGRQWKRAELYGDRARSGR